MIVTVQEPTIVKPCKETPKETLWTSNVDHLFRKHMPTVYFYRPDGSFKFFDATVLRDTLSKVLVPFFPVAGRLKKDKNGRLEIECNGEGVLFVEAYTESALDDLGDFEPSVELMKLIPGLRQGQDIFSSPLLLLQVTYFKCGGVSLGAAVQHTVLDGVSGTHFINSWARTARGFDINTPPCVDRTLLRARKQPSPAFPHIEYQTPPSLKTTSPKETNVTTFKISRDQIKLLKAQCKEESNSVSFSSFEVLAGHIWRCATKARGLLNDQATTVSIVVDGRTRLNPKLPFEYLGNAIFPVSPKATSGDIVSNPLAYTVQKVHETIVRADDEYLRSALDYLELQPEFLQTGIVRSSQTFGCPNLAIMSWCHPMSIHDADFGWGRPVYMGPGAIMREGFSYLLPSSSNDGSVSLSISLHADCIVPFKKYFLDF